MANSFDYNNQKYTIGDTLSIKYKIQEGGKTRQQIFKGIVIDIKGSTSPTRMITVRHMSRSGVGVERIIPLSSPYISDIKLNQKSMYRRARANFVRSLSPKKLSRKLYHQK